MIAAQQGDLVGQRVFGTMSEDISRAPFDDTFIEQVRQVAVPGDLPETDNDADFGQSCDLGREMGRAVANLLWHGLIAGRSAANNRANPDLTQLEAIVAADGRRFVGEPKFVEDRIHEVAGPIAGKRPSSPVRSVGSWRKAEDEDASVRVAEAGHRLCPVFLVTIRFAPGFAYASDIGDKAGTEGAIRDGLLKRIENGKETLWGRPLRAHV